MDEGLTCKISKFPDDTKITGRVTTTIEKALLQSDLDRLVNWSKKWQMTYNIDKCKVLHTGSNNNCTNYTMKSTEITKVKREKDLRVIIRNDLKPGKHSTEVVKSTNKLIGFIGRTFEFKLEKVVLTLFNALVRPHLEYCVQFWSSFYRKDRQTGGSPTTSYQTDFTTAKHDIRGTTARRYDRGFENVPWLWHRRCQQLFCCRPGKKHLQQRF